MLNAIKVACGWCPRQPDEDPNTSHGVCPEHEQEILDQSDARQFMKGFPPSYVENREAFEEYKENKRAKR